MMEEESKVVSLYQDTFRSQNDHPATQSTKNLFSKTIKLLGHQGCVNTCKFSQCGDYLASAGHDKSILIWDIFDPQCKNLGALKGHGNSVLDLVWNEDSTILYSVSADRSTKIWDVSTGQKIKKLRVHQDVVNSVDIMKSNSNLLVTASDDFTVVLWDLRSNDTLLEIDINFPVTSVCFGKSSSQMLIYFGGLDNTIKAFNLKTNQIEYELKGHHDTITGLSVSKSGKYLLSNAMDQTIKVWDIQPYIQGGNESRCIKTMLGAKHNYEKNLLRCDWNFDDSLITAGSADGMLNIWQFESGNLLSKLGGHNASLNQPSFHPSNPNIIVSASTDRTLNLGEFTLN